MKNSIILLCSLVLFNTSFTQAATVKGLRGKVFQLSMRAHVERLVKKGNSFREGAFLGTSKNSHLEIELKNGALLTLGPDSQVKLIELSKNKNMIIELVRGQLRAKVDAQELGEKNKLYIKTPSAAMIIKGADFQTVYNTRNGVTTLLTFKGTVGFVKSDNLAVQRSTNTEIVRDDEDGKISLKKGVQKRLTREEQFIYSFKGKDVIEVKNAQASMTLKKFNNVSLPVNISPIQFNILYKNKNFKVRKSKEIKLAQMNFDEKGPLFSSVRQSVALEGIFNLSEKVFAPKSGGLIDFKTGFYIPPSEDALLNPKYNVYQAQSIGGVDKETGQYKAPLGLSLTSNNGFVMKKFKANAPKKLKEKISTQRLRMNEELRSDLILSTSNDFSATEMRRGYSKRELLNKNGVSFRLGSQTETIIIKNDTYKNIEKEYKGESSLFFRLNWDHQTKGRWHPTSSFSHTKIDIPGDQRGGIAQSSKRLNAMMLGVKYNMSSRWNLALKLELSQEIFLNHQKESSNVETSLIRITLPKVLASFEGTIIRSGRLSINTDFILGSNLRKESGTFEVSSGLIWGPKLFARWWFARDFWTSLGLYYQKESYGVKNTIFTADTSRKRSGVLFEFGLAL